MKKRYGILSALLYLGLCSTSYADVSYTDADFPINESLDTYFTGNIDINTTNAINPVITGTTGKEALWARTTGVVVINNDTPLTFISQNGHAGIRVSDQATFDAYGDIIVNFESTSTSRGVYSVSQSTVQFHKNLTITSASKNAIGAMIYSSGSLTMTDANSTLSINLSGDGAYGIVGQTEQATADQTFTSNAKVDINLSGVGTTGISTQYLTQGANAKSTLTFNNDVSVVTDHGEALWSQLKNGVFNFNAKSTFISKDAETYNAVVNLEGTINISGETEIQGDMVFSGQDSHTFINAKMTTLGNITTEDQADLTMNATSGSLLKGSINSDTTAQTSLTLAPGAEWAITADSKFQTLNNQGKVTFVDNGVGAYTNLTLDTISGAGTFVMNTDIANQVSDKIFVTNTSGTHMVTIANNGSASTNGTERFDMIETGDGVGTFVGTNTVELGGYEYQFGRSSTNANNWGIFSVPSTGTEQPSPGEPSPNLPSPVTPVYPGGGKITTTANAAASFASASYLISYIDTQMLMTRMGELRNNQKSTKGDVWARGFGGKINAFSVGKVAGFDMSYGGVQFGADKAFELSNGMFYGGLAFSYLSGNPDYWGGDANFKSYQASLYATYIADNGYYIDSVLKYLHQKNKFDVRDTVGHKVNGSASSDGWGLSVEVGKRFILPDNRFYIEPQAQLSYSSLGGNNTYASNGLRINIDDTESLLGRIGGTIGYKLVDIKNPTHLYAKAYYVHEFKGNVDYKLNGNAEGHSFKGDWADFAVGINAQISKKHNIYGEIHYATGNKFDDTRFNAGYRFQF